MTRNTITVEQGFEARDLAMLVQTAGGYKSNIRIRSGRYEVNAKSMMGVMALSLGSGDKAEVICEGADEKEAMEGLTSFLCGK